MLDLTVAYVAERKQFGVPIGSFQAVKHHLADAALKLALRRARPSTAPPGRWPPSADRRRDVSMAKAMASDAARLAGRQALQCHGAIGYTVEYDLHLYLKRAEALARSLGRRRLAPPPGRHRPRHLTAGPTADRRRSARRRPMATSPPD